MTKQEAMATNGQATNNSDTDDKLRKTSIKSKTMTFMRNITVEPLIGIFQMSIMLTSLATVNLNLQKACRVNLKLGDEMCTSIEKLNATFLDHEKVEVQVQQLMSDMLIWQNVIQNAIPCMLLMFIGPWSDRNGKRKPFMLMPIFGELVRIVGLIVCVYFFYELPMEIAGLVESVPSSITGSMPVLFLAVFAYVGDITTVKSRTLRVGYVSLCCSISVPIGSALSGVLFKQYGFYGVYYTGTVLYLLCFVYGIVIIRDKKPDVVVKTDDIEDRKKSTQCSIGDFFDLKHVKKAFHVTFKEGSSERRINIILLFVIVIVFSGPLSGEQVFTYLLTRVKYNWNEVDYSIFQAYYFICNLLGIGLTLLLLVNQFKIDDRLLGALGCLSKGLAAFVYAFAPTGTVFYIGPIIDIFHGTALVALRSMLSKLVPANELGQVLAVFSLVETAVPAIFKPLYSVIYRNTVHSFPSAFYIFGGILNIPGVLIFLLMYKNKKLTEKAELNEEKQALNSQQA